MNAEIEEYFYLLREVCRACYIACRDGGHQALSFDEETHRPTLIPDKCVGCHLCALVCPEHAIRGDGKRMGKKKK